MKEKKGKEKKRRVRNVIRKKIHEENPTKKNAVLSRKNVKKKLRNQRRRKSFLMTLMRGEMEFEIVLPSTFVSSRVKNNRRTPKREKKGQKNKEGWNQ